ncbi:branched-chain amino acid ABC transporter permease [Alkalilimnicola sp. S0819]|uniref:branched-chain amino acid ABC transporter permease n=1 Tax=Alkalilimnicola sp. S0819 TaxID=2613922 RepID=UPI001261556C|nr:branched-chain amino acid ABC transporter permease [Alkalilimnicola sp. S0819]KAB7628296.1 branched-chain amino acid ABC transporter permease [Alkalilimnicola sp. S0819]MPQ15193.1 branched-chain amino acid ABC transporter permease [Alkalilimnicola sp. S0819]
MTAQSKTLENKPSLSPAELVDKYPHYFLLALIAVPAFFAMPFSAWATMTLSGLAMGLMIFIMSSGMTLTFGLMSVLNLAHGAFIALGAYAAFSMLENWLPGLWESTNFGANMVAIVAALVFAMVLAGVLGYVFERLILKPVYGDHLKQILVTVGGGIVLIELVKVFWGPNEYALVRPDALRGSFVFGDVILEQYRLLAVVVGLLVFWGMLRVINKTKVGLLIRAGVESTEMVEVQGYRIKQLFIAVFVAGSALAAVGGVMWGMYQELVVSTIGDHMLVMVIIVIIIGGLGSITGCFFGAVLVGLLYNYVGYLFPHFTEFSAITLMVLVLMWRPQGLIPVIKV